MQSGCRGPRGELPDAAGEAGPQPSRRLCSRPGFSPQRLWHTLRGVRKALLGHQLERPRGAGVESGTHVPWGAQQQPCPHPLDAGTIPTSQL